MTTSETKWTPGPWEAQPSERRRTLCVVSTDTWICGEIQNGNQPIPNEEAWANARLIAAAPALYEALAAVHALVSEGAATGFNPHDGDWAMRLFESNGPTSDALRSARVEG